MFHLGVLRAEGWGGGGGGVRATKDTGYVGTAEDF
jgi:hypothetical protein